VHHDSGCGDCSHGCALGAPPTPLARRDGLTLQRSLELGSVTRFKAWCIEGDEAAKYVARQLIGDLNGQASEIRPEHKMLYHAAAAVAGNLLTGLMSVSFSMLEHCGIAPAQARAMLIRLSEGVLQRIKAEGEVVALAGPISRGDTATVAQHLEQLRALPPVYGAIYRSLSQELVTLARHKGATVAALTDIETLLQG